MNPIYLFLLRRATYEALFLALWLYLGEKPGEIKDVSFEDVAKIAERYGLRASVAVIRNKLKELVALRIVEKEDLLQRGRFHLSVFNPCPDIFQEERAEETPPLFLPENQNRFQNGNGCENWNENENRFKRFDGDSAERSQLVVKSNVEKMICDVSSSSAAGSCCGAEEKTMKKSAQERININQESKKERKRPSLKISNSEEETFSRSAARVREYVDFEAPKTIALRKEVAKIVWERGVRPDYVDRLTAAIQIGIPGLKCLDDLRAIDRDARESVELFKRSKGFSGKEKRWMSTNLTARAIYEGAGYAYPETRRGYEPNPTTVANARRRPVAVADDSDDDVLSELSPEIAARIRFRETAEV